MIQNPFVLAACLAAAIAAGWGAALLLNAMLGQPRPHAAILAAANVALTVWAAWVMPANVLFPLSCVLGWTLCALTAADILSFRLPDIFTLPLIVIGIAVAWLLPEPDMTGHIVGAAAGLAAFTALAWLYRRLRGREGLGFGDAKLAAAAGAWLGWEALPSVVLVGAVGGIVWVLVRYLLRGPTALTERMPFGVPLCVSFWLAWLYGPLIAFSA